jgi:hypothetical protein
MPVSTHGRVLVGMLCEAASLLFVSFTPYVRTGTGRLGDGLLHGQVTFRNLENIFKRPL